MSLIVIVDDRVSNRNIFAKLAASIEADLTVRTFSEPLSALEWMKDNRPDLIITDYKMPNLDGAQFIAEFRKRPACADIPIIVITVYEERSFRLRALEAGATDFLHSPVDHHEFVTRARNLLKLQRHQLLLANRAQLLQQDLEKSERTKALALRDSSQRLAQVIDTVPALIRACDRNGALLFANAYQAAFDGVDANSVIGQTTQAIHGAERWARDAALDKIVFETGKALPPFEEELIDASGCARVFLTTKSPLKSIGDGVQAVLTSSLDITARKRMEAHLRHLAHHDALTDLPNRVLLHESMRKLVARARRGDKLFAVHTIDLDGFKAVNDLLGHAAGDEFIKNISKKLQAVIRDSDTIARTGGDEFIVLQSDVTSNADAADLASRLLATIEEFSDFDGAPITISASIGIAIHPTDGADVDELLRHSDLAMYRAKSEQGNHFCFYASDMTTRARQLASLDKKLQRAFENGEFILHYQPQVDVLSGRLIGAEALLRWNDPDSGIVAPSLFLPRAEENGLIVPINEWVMQKACEDARRWQKFGLGPIPVSVNMSPVQFRRRTAPLHVARVLASTGLDPRLLDIELTESIVMSGIENIAQELQHLIDIGVSLSIDDFGTGYSSLSYVKYLPVSRLKIDQSFIRNLPSDPNDAAIVRAIVTLGHSLNLSVLAEGVETVQQLERLREEGCDQAQGFLFGRPAPSDEFVKRATNAIQLARSA